MIVIPLRTAADVRRTPHVNYGLIGVNVVLFLVFNSGAFGPQVTELVRPLEFRSGSPGLLQFITYQFLHADAWHLIGNLLFLWVFGNAVNGKMGDIPYLLFYLAGGVFSAWGYAAVRQEAFTLIGASGSIAAITTAYFVLFPRSHVTVLVWLFFFIHLFEVPAMLLIGVKIIVWDNIIAPSLGGGGQVAYGAHLAGYLFGFAASIIMLLSRALPRDQFDLLALWRRWNQRRSFAAATSTPEGAARAQYGPVARIPVADAARRAAENQRLDRIADLRNRVAEAADKLDFAAAAGAYEELLAVDAKQCMSERAQLALGRHYYAAGQFPLAVTTFERFVECYPASAEHGHVRLLLGIIYARDLNRHEPADEHLTKALNVLRDESRKAQAMEWLKHARAALGRPMPEGTV